jgi:hypothetical protein
MTAIAVRRLEAANLLGISPRQLDQWIAEGKVHKPFKLSPRIVLFDVARLQADWVRIRDEASKEETNEWDEVLPR